MHVHVHILANAASETVSLCLILVDICTERASELVSFLSPAAGCGSERRTDGGTEGRRGSAGEAGKIRSKIAGLLTHSLAEILALKQESRILGQWYNHVSGSRKSQPSSPWAKQHRV